MPCLSAVLKSPHSLHGLASHNTIGYQKLSTGSGNRHNFFGKMASKPGPLTDWPWHKLGNFKYLLLAPTVAKAIHNNFLGGQEADNFSLVILLLVALRYIHNQLWISVSRFQNARSKRQIQSKSIQFEQVDRERNWDDTILLHALLLVPIHAFIPGASDLPLWKTKGFIVAWLVHMGPAEFIYYWAHRALHHHFLYTRYHSHHHSSFVTEPITSVVHPFAEHLLYAAMFALPLLATVVTKSASIMVFFCYFLWFDFMNNMGHCNFEFIPKWAFQIFPPLKYLMYTPSFHSLHHSQVHTNFSLFMPIYDYIFGTVDKSSDNLYEAKWKGGEEKIDFVYLTHPTTSLSIFHLRFGFASFAARPYSSKWYMWFMWPISKAIMLLLRIFGRPFGSEKNRLDQLQMQTWVIPRYTFQYFLPSERPSINQFIQECILEAEKKGAKVISLGLLNKSQDLNGGGELFLQRLANLRIRIVNGNALAAAVVINSIPKAEEEVMLLCGEGTEDVGYGLARVLCERSIRVQLLVDSTDHFRMTKTAIPPEFHHNLRHCTGYQSGNHCKTWIAARWVDEEEQMKAPKGTHFLQFLPFPIPKARKDCTYEMTPALHVPKTMQNVHSCENWLPRGVMSAWRVGGIVHALEGWDHHECGTNIINSVRVAEVWEAALKHGFSPASSSAN